MYGILRHDPERYEFRDRMSIAKHRGNESTFKRAVALELSFGECELSVFEQPAPSLSPTSARLEPWESELPPLPRLNCFVRENIDFRLIVAELQRNKEARKLPAIPF